LSNVLEDDPGTGTADAEAPKESVRGYRPELDVVRFIAFLLVFFHHLLPIPSMEQSGWRILLSLYESCAMGLCLFFTLSAYLITGILLTEREDRGHISVRKFYIRRILRIWPLYFVGIASGIGIALMLHRASDILGFAWYLLFAGNLYCIFFGWLGNPFVPLWTISIEEQFYLIWPWAMRWFSRRNLFLCALFVIAVANLTLFQLSLRNADTDRVVWANTLVQFEMFATGILLALAKKYLAWKNFSFGLLLAWTGPLLWFMACYLFHIKQPAAAGRASGGAEMMIGYALVALGCAAILHGICMIGPSSMPRWATYLGKISYGLYVYHVLAIEFSQVVLASLRGIASVAASGALALLLTISAAILSFNYLESPFLRLKRRFEIVHSRPI
jgi:peptidoglycan/LPS O-acetylase OafA/YrhL